ncbi:uncharacterized protein LOC123534162 [Mercenaria mercenaria]|uniref:uncharacterized protein LOC123534162 n=1 Tax=Mercenaria mercenaria TaxID=6596 RepID=UPI00234EDD17|nr:uncharacterized protein LOC123534162 [Mercenaria mercenaria]XP_045172197.2 uncharacterized protein LOC123534162 [Mercenaria mercenaria]XP_045172198.2 uncharacterized protein LOC123534162 [Mercenaria mercenaria]
MADGDKKPTAESAGIGMKLTIAGIKKKFPTVKNLSTEALSSLMESVQLDSSAVSDRKEKLLILDSRPDEEYTVGHIPGARRVDYQADQDSLISAVPELQSPDGDMTVVCYCSVGYRSSVVAQTISEYIKRKGIQDKDMVKVYNLEGSIFKWANENRPMIDSRDRRTIYTHPYNVIFGKLLRKELRKTSLEEDS